MMGQQGGGQDKLFYSFNPDEHVPANHLLRGIDQMLELRAQLAPFHSHTGRPSVDPELILRMRIVGYCCGIRSERRLCEEVHLNLAYRWFCRLGLDAQVPNHSTFSPQKQTIPDVCAHDLAKRQTAIGQACKLAGRPAAIARRSMRHRLEIGPKASKYKVIPANAQ